MSYTPDNSGIKSLAGFSFQIKVFCIFASQLKEGQQVEFESIDDVATNKNCKPEKLDLVNGRMTTQEFYSVQVKHTKMDVSNAKNVLLNWIQLEDSPNTVTKYILITDEAYNNEDLIQTIDIDKFINEIMASNKKANANITKVKEVLKNKSDSERKTIINRVLQKYKFRSINIYSELIDSFKDKLFKSVNDFVYHQRLEEFLSEITNRIFKAISVSKPFFLTYDDLQKILNEIIQNFTTEISLPSYNNFRTINPIDLNNTEIANSREYKQLLTCELSANLMRNHLLHEQYYQKARSNFIDACMETKCGDIEVTAYENFENIKEELIDNNSDTPKNRLRKTTMASNSYAGNEQIQDGVCIYLTADNIGDNQISWKDE